MGDLCRADAACCCVRARRGGTPEAFWRGWRVVALDGTPIQRDLYAADRRRPRRRRGRGAAEPPSPSSPRPCCWKWGCTIRSPPAIGRHGESEWALAQRLLAQLPRRALLLGDRLYGVPAFVAPVARGCAPRRQSLPAARRPDAIKPRLPAACPMGPALIQIALRARPRPNPILEWLDGPRDSRARRPPGHRVP